jgi:hypothetical protein
MQRCCLLFFQSSLPLKWTALQKYSYFLPLPAALHIFWSSHTWTFHQPSFHQGNSSLASQHWKLLYIPSEALIIISMLHHFLGNPFLLLRWAFKEAAKSSTSSSPSTYFVGHLGALTTNKALLFHFKCTIHINKVQCLPLWGWPGGIKWIHSRR